MRIDKDGKIGIGNASPSNILHVGHSGTSGNDGIIIVREDSDTTQNEWLGGIGFESNDGTIRRVTESCAGVGAYANDNHGQVGALTDKGADLIFWTTPVDSTTAAEGMRIKGSGYVGIGTATPKAPLQVSGYNNQDSGNTNNFLKYGQNADGTWVNGTITYNYGLWVDNIIYADAIIVSSDERVKQDIVDLDDSSSLDKIRQIKPKSFKYIDQVENSSFTNYGFVAQEVKNILPNCVDNITNFIPNFFTNCTIARNNSSGLLEISTTKNLTFNSLHDSNGNAYVDNSNNPSSDSSGNKIFNIKLISSNDVLVHVKTKSVTSSTLLTIEDTDYHNLNTITEGSYFLYGQEVDDFHNLNQDMIYTICIAAVQEIDRQQTSDKAEISTLKTQYNDLLARVTALENT